MSGDARSTSDTDPTIVDYAVQMEQIREMFAKMAEALKPAFEALRCYIEACRDLCWEWYEAAGKPYGPTRDDMWNWLRDSCAAALEEEEEGAG